MIDYIQKSQLWNPYEHGKELVKWIATYYSLKKEKGKQRKGFWNNSTQRRSLSKEGNRVFDFIDEENDKLENNVPIWQITFEKLSAAYKKTAMKRHLAWDTEENQEGTGCIPVHKLFSKRGNFPRRITWLYVKDGR